MKSPNYEPPIVIEKLYNAYPISQLAPGTVVILDIGRSTFERVFITLMMVRIISVDFEPAADGVERENGTLTVLCLETGKTKVLPMYGVCVAEATNEDDFPMPDVKGPYLIKSRALTPLTKEYVRRQLWVNKRKLEKLEAVKAIVAALEPLAATFE